MSQPIESKAALWKRINELYSQPNSGARMQLLRDLCATNSSLWTDAAEPVGDLRPSPATPSRPAKW